MYLYGASMSTPDDASVSDGDWSPSQAIIEAIADEEGIDVTDVEPPEYDPLYTVVNPEALDDLFAPTGDRSSNVVVSLEYEGYDLVVRSGSVAIRDGSATDAVGRPIEE